MTRRELSTLKIDNLCQKDRRIFLTRNKGIKNFKAKREVLSSECVFEQIKCVLAKYKINEELISSRCIKCNVKLRLSNVREDTKYCPRCGKSFWKGTHYQSMLRVLYSKNMLV